MFCVFFFFCIFSTWPYAFTYYWQWQMFGPIPKSITEKPFKSQTTNYSFLWILDFRTGKWPPSASIIGGERHLLTASKHSELFNKFKKVFKKKNSAMPSLIFVWMVSWKTSITEIIIFLKTKYFHPFERQNFKK